MTDIFQVGDVVYHPYLGKGVVRDAFCVDFANDEAWHHDTEYGTALLSFTPWPEPDHVRPLKDGVYKVAYQSYPTILARFDNRWWCVDTSFTNVIKCPVSYQGAITSPEFLYPFQDKMDE